MLVTLRSAARRPIAARSWAATATGPSAATWRARQNAPSPTLRAVHRPRHSRRLVGARSLPGWTTATPPHSQPSAAPAPASSVAVIAPRPAAYTGEVNWYVNTYRKRAGAPPVALQWQLNQAAQRHANEMAQRRYITHTGKDGSNAGTRISRTGYRWWIWGEDVAAGQTTVYQVMSRVVQLPVTPRDHPRSALRPHRTRTGSSRGRHPLLVPRLRQPRLSAQRHRASLLLLVRSVDRRATGNPHGRSTRRCMTTQQCGIDRCHLPTRCSLRMSPASHMGPLRACERQGHGTT